MLGASVQRYLTQGAADGRSLPSRLRAADATLRRRLSDWWNGGEMPEGIDAAPPPVVQETAEPGDPSPAVYVPPPYWTPDRMEIAQRIWGEEHVHPGGETYAASLLNTLTLNAAHAVVEIGAGLGASTRLMHRSFKVWGKGFEPNRELAAAGSALSGDAGMARKAPIAAIDLGAPGLKRGAADRLILRDLLHTVRDKAGLLRVLGEAMKPKGQMLLTDFVLRDASVPPDAVLRWARGEPVASNPGTLRGLKNLLRESGFTVHVFVDESALMREMILDGWDGFRAALPGSPIYVDQYGVMFDEGERWRRCVAALETGALQYVRTLVSR